MILHSKFWLKDFVCFIFYLNKKFGLSEDTKKGITEGREWITEVECDNGEGKAAKC